mgnify:CR=1 FL=1
MSFKTSLLTAVAKIIVGSQLFDRIKACVFRQEEKILSGPEKRHAVTQELMVIGVSVATWVLNFAIEVAVAQLRILAQENNEKN